MIGDIKERGCLEQIFKENMQTGSFKKVMTCFHSFRFLFFFKVTKARRPGGEKEAETG